MRFVPSVPKWTDVFLLLHSPLVHSEGVWTPHLHWFCPTIPDPRYQSLLDLYSAVPQMGLNFHPESTEMHHELDKTAHLYQHLWNFLNPDLNLINEFQLRKIQKSYILAMLLIIFTIRQKLAGKYVHIQCKLLGHNKHGLLITYELIKHQQMLHILFRTDQYKRYSWSDTLSTLSDRWYMGPKNRLDCRPILRPSNSSLYCLSRKRLAACHWSWGPE